MTKRIGVAICALMVLATLFVCFQPQTAISSTSNSQTLPSDSVLNKHFPTCKNIADPGHNPNLKDNGCGQPLIQANPTERLTHTPFLPR